MQFRHYSITLCELFHKGAGLTIPPLRSRSLLPDLYSAATAAVAPGPALARRLEQEHIDQERRIWILALGKAGLPMARTAVELLSAHGTQPVGGLVVGPALADSPHPALRYIRGDHPEPGPGSQQAAADLARVVAQISSTDEVWVLLSGGTTSLIGAPEPGLTQEELSAIYRMLLGSGLDITAMNRIRKRFSRWGGGKLARALAPARVRVYVVSDVIGDDLASIGSGPCAPDSATASEVRLLLETAGLWRRIPEAARSLVVSAEAGTVPETPKPGDPVFARVTLEVIASNRLALEAAAARASELGVTPLIMETAIAGEASETGRHLAADLLQHCGRRQGPQPNADSPPVCLIWGGETTVSLGDRAGVGGRCQELALAAAKTLDGGPGDMALLAAGTDGRDGPTDAAGAIVDTRTWRRIRETGRDPAQDLATHNAYAALDSVGALLRTGLTQTNVMDVVFGVCLDTESGER